MYNITFYSTYFDETTCREYDKIIKGQFILRRASEKKKGVETVVLDVLKYLSNKFSWGLTFTEIFNSFITFFAKSVYLNSQFIFL